MRHFMHLNYKKHLYVFSIFFLASFIFFETAYAEKLKVRIGIDQSQSFYNVTEDGKPIGYSYEYLSYLEEFGALEFIYIYGRREALVNMLRKGDIDLLDHNVKTRQLENEFLFSTLSTGFTNLSLVTTSNNNEFNFNNFQSFNGKNIGHITSEYISDTLSDFASKNTLTFFTHTYPNVLLLDSALSAKNIDLAAKESFNLSRNEKIVANIDTRNFYLMTRQDKAELMSTINATQLMLYEKHPALIDELYKKYFSSDYSVFNFSQKEIEYVEKLEPLRVLYLENSSPFSSYSVANDKVEGLNIQVWENIAEQTQLKYKLQPVANVEEGLELISSKNADLLIAVESHTNIVSNNKIKLSDSYLSIPISIVGIEESIIPSDVFVFPKSSHTELDYFKSHYPKNQYFLVDTIKEAYDAIVSGKADFTIDNLFSASFLLQQPAYLDLIFVAATYTNDYLSYAISESIEPQLFSIINKAILNFSKQENDSLFLTHTISGTRNENQLSYFLKHYQTELILLLIFIVFTAFLFLLFIIFLQANNKKTVWNLAYLDQLTKLPNFNKFKIDAQKLLIDNPNTKYAILIMDINKFSLINESRGQEEGDKIIIAMADAMKHFIKEKNDLLSRINADNFVVFYEVTNFSTNNDQIASFYLPFRDLMKARTGLTLNFSIGRYTLTHDDKNINEIFEKVNSAHNLAKVNSAISPLYDYDEDLKKLAIRQREIENLMESALENNEFLLYLQPKYSLSNEQVVGAEALVRWNEPNNPKVVYPSEFIPIFEKNGFITKLDFYMFRKACEVIEAWIKEGKEPVTVSVNFSRLHLNNPHFVDDIKKIADGFDIPKKYLEIELTESTMIDNEDALENLVNHLHEAGFKLSMDDFGTGYSSLGLLKNLPVDVIKIDRSFFTNNRYKTRARAVLQSIISMAKALNIHTVAEGVEEQEHIDFLREIGCEQVQGYFYAKPMPAVDFITNHRVVKANKNVIIDDALANKIGDLHLGREEMGLEMPVAMYRLFEFSVREALIQMYGEGEMEKLLMFAGQISGANFTSKYLNLSLPYPEFIKNVRNILVDFKVGFLDIESFDKNTGEFIITVKEDLDCSGMPNISKPLCQYDAGFLAAILSEYTKKTYTAKEIDCWGTGANLCRFEAKPLPQDDII